MANRIDELREMSDAELNALSTKVVMGWTSGFVNRLEKLRAWSPSSSIAAAFEMLEEKFPPSSHTISMEGEFDGWSVIIFGKYPKRIGSALDKTLPRAITIAAILAAESK